VLKSVHDVPAERLDILSLDIAQLKPQLVLAILDGSSVVARDGMDSYASKPLARYPARIIFDQLESLLKARGAAVTVKVIGVLINKADLWCTDDVAERRRVVTLVEKRLRAYALLGEAVRQGRIKVFVRAIALTRPGDFKTRGALEDIARHSAHLSSETLMEFKGRANDIIAQAA